MLPGRADTLIRHYLLTMLFLLDRGGLAFPHSTHRSIVRVYRGAGKILLDDPLFGASWRSRNLFRISRLHGHTTTSLECLVSYTAQLHCDVWVIWPSSCF